jgi:hypothetical protein
VYVVEDGILRRRNIEIEWQNDNEALVSSGLVPGDVLVTTALGQVTSGIRVSIVGEQPRRPNASIAGEQPRRSNAGNASEQPRKPDAGKPDPNRQRPGGSK